MELSSPGFELYAALLLPAAGRVPLFKSFFRFPEKNGVDIVSENVAQNCFTHRAGLAEGQFLSVRLLAFSQLQSQG